MWSMNTSQSGWHKLLLSFGSLALALSLPAHSCPGMRTFPPELTNAKGMQILSRGVLTQGKLEFACLDGKFIFFTRDKPQLVKTSSGEISIARQSTVVVETGYSIVRVQNVYGSPCSVRFFHEHFDDEFVVDAGEEFCWAPVGIEGQLVPLDGVSRTELREEGRFSTNYRYVKNRFDRMGWFERDRLIQGARLANQQRHLVEELKKRIETLEDNFSAEKTDCNEHAGVLVLKEKSKSAGRVRREMDYQQVIHDKENLGNCTQ